jgi:hypothetical protein
MVFSFCYIRLKMELLVICNTSIVILRICVIVVDYDPINGAL